MSCGGDCKCGDKDKREFDRLAELERFMETQLLSRGEDNSSLKLLMNPLVYRTDDVTTLQFTGWAIKLYSDGKWIVTDTSGG